MGQIIQGNKQRGHQVKVVRDAIKEEPSSKGGEAVKIGSPDTLSRRPCAQAMAPEKGAAFLGIGGLAMLALKLAITCSLSSSKVRLLITAVWQCK